MAADEFTNGQLQESLPVVVDERTASQSLASPRAIASHVIPPSPPVAPGAAFAVPAMIPSPESPASHNLVTYKRAFSNGNAFVDSLPSAPFHVQKRSKIGADSIGCGGGGASPTDSECEGCDGDRAAAANFAAAPPNLDGSSQCSGAVAKRVTRVATVEDMESTRSRV